MDAEKILYGGRKSQGFRTDVKTVEDSLYLENVI